MNFLIGKTACVFICDALGSKAKQALKMHRTGFKLVQDEKCASEDLTSKAMAQPSIYSSLTRSPAVVSRITTVQANNRMFRRLVGGSPIIRFVDFQSSVR